MSKPLPDGTQPGYQGKPERLSTELDNLQQEIGRDYEKRIIDLSALMGRFKALMANEVRDPQLPDHTQAANDTRSPSPDSANQTLFSAQQDPPAEKSGPVAEDKNTSVATDSIPVLTSVVPDQTAANPLPTRKRAQFERGLYHLNSQLQRYRLELDQELEFRQEPLHVHFRNQSELANILQQIALDMHKPESNQN